MSNDNHSGQPTEVESHMADTTDNRLTCGLCGEPLTEIYRSHCTMRPDSMPDHLPIAGGMMGVIARVNELEDTVAELRVENEQLKEWRDSVSNAIKQIPEFATGKWGGDKDEWGYHFEIVRWITKSYADLEASLAWLVEAVIRHHDIVATPNYETWLKRAKECGKQWRERSAEDKETIASLKEELEAEKQQRHELKEIANAGLSDMSALADVMIEDKRILKKEIQRLSIKLAASEADRDAAREDYHALLSEFDEAQETRDAAWRQVASVVVRVAGLEADKAQLILERDDAIAIADRNEIQRQHEANRWFEQKEVMEADNARLRQQLITRQTDEISGKWSDECRAAVRGLESRFNIELISSQHHGEWVDRCEKVGAENQALRQWAEAAVQKAQTFYLKELAPLSTRAAAAEAKYRAAMLALESLTPGGSEFVGDVEACVKHVRARR